MKTKFLCVCASLFILGTIMAQEVDKSVVTAQAAAAESAADDLKKADTGEKNWKCSGIVGLNASATGLINWAAGGNNNITGVAFGKVRLLYHKDAIAWDSNLDLEYGLSYIDQKADKLQKANDHIIFTTKFGWEFKETWYLTCLAGFRSQFALGRNYEGLDDQNEIISKFLAPSYTDISVGIDWKPNTIFSVYISPIAGRIATAYVSERMNEKYAKLMDRYGLGTKIDGQMSLRESLQEKNGVWKYDKYTNEKQYPNTSARAELGLSLKGAINYQYKDLKIITTIALYTPYAWDKTKLYDYTVGEGGTFTEQQLIDKGYDMNLAKFIGYRDNNRRFGNFDVDWDFAISYQFLKCLNVTLSTSLKYYNGVKIDKMENGVMTSAERVQFMGTLGIGVGYSF